MSEVLSQNEIDNLLAALSSGEVDVEEMSKGDEKKVKDYDFKRPAKFSKEHLRTLEIIFEHYGRLLATTLPLYLRKNVQVSVENSETVTFSEFSKIFSTSFDASKSFTFCVIPVGIPPHFLNLFQISTV